MKLIVARHVALLSALLCLPAAPLLAQTEAPQANQNDSAGPPMGGPRKGGAEHRAEMLQRSLNLSPEQTAQVKSLLGEERTKMEALHGNSSLSPEARHTQRMAMHQDTNSRIKALLTADQAGKFDALEARMRGHHPGHGGPPPSSSAPDPGQQ